MGQRGLSGQSLIIFTSDHGDYDGGAGPSFQQILVVMTEVSLPMGIIRELIRPEKKAIVDSPPGGAVDWIPTICDAAGIVPDPRLPALSLLSGQGARKGAFSEFPRRRSGEPPACALLDVREMRITS